MADKTETKDTRETRRTLDGKDVPVDRYGNPEVGETTRRVSTADSGVVEMRYDNFGNPLGIATK